MRQTLTAALVALGALAAPAFAAGTPAGPGSTAAGFSGATAGNAKAPAFRVEAVVLRSFGETSYEMNALTPDPRDPGRLVPIRSRLEFPLDATLLGVRLSWRAGRENPGPWSLSAGYRFALDDPAGTLTDGDFFDGRQVSLAESDPTWDLRAADAELRYRLHRGERATVAVLLHLDHERIEQHAVGFEGWRSGLFSDFRTPISGTYPVLDYRVTYWSPRLGGAFGYRLAGRAEVDLQGSAGMVFASDVDDHLARSRLTEGNGTGIGLHQRTAFRLMPGALLPSPLSASLMADLRYFRAEGKATQRWYGDDTVPAGTVIADLLYKIESLRFQVGLSVDLHF